MFRMKRRAFISLLGSAVAAWPLAARAQQGERMRRIGVLTPLVEDALRPPGSFSLAKELVNLKPDLATKSSLSDAHSRVGYS